MTQLTQRECDQLLRSANVQQFTPVELDGDKCLLTSFATLENGRYFNPRSNKSFKYDHIKHVAYDVQGEAPTSHNDKLRETIQSKVENNFFFLNI